MGGKGCRFLDSSTGAAHFKPIAVNLLEESGQGFSANTWILLGVRVGIVNQSTCTQSTVDDMHPASTNTYYTTMIPRFLVYFRIRISIINGK